MDLRQLIIIQTASWSLLYVRIPLDSHNSVHTAMRTANVVRNSPHICRHLLAKWDHAQRNGTLMRPQEGTH